MSGSTRVFFTGGSLDLAVTAAAEHHGVEPDDVAYERVERRGGPLRTRRNVVIKVDPEHPTRERDPAVEEGDNVATPPRESVAPDPPENQQDFNPIPQAPPGQKTEESLDERAPAGGSGHPQGRPGDAGEELPEADSELPLPSRNLPLAEGEAAEAAAEATRQLASIAGLDLEVVVFQGEEELEVELSGPDQELLVRGEGRLLLAIQHLLPRVLRGSAGTMGACRVDSQRFRERRVSRLEQMALGAAEDVRREGRAYTLQSMNPADRRTIHLALKNASDVVTESNGQGFYKRVTILPA